MGMLIKAIYERFGKEAIDIIRDVCGRQGHALGLKVKNKVSDTKLSTVAQAFADSYDPNDVKVITISDETFRIQGNKCPFGLENTSRELCEAVMEIDHKYFRTAVNDNITLTIHQTLAAGDSRCDTTYKIPSK
jgi:Zn-dependent membrane protease YugP